MIKLEAFAQFLYSFLASSELTLLLSESPGEIHFSTGDARIVASFADEGEVSMKPASDPVEAYDFKVFFDQQQVAEAVDEKIAGVAAKSEYVIDEDQPLLLGRIVDAIFSGEPIEESRIREDYIYPFILDGADMEVVKTLQPYGTRILKFKAAYQGLDVYVTSGLSDDVMKQYDAEPSEQSSGFGFEYYFVAKPADTALVEYVISIWEYFISKPDMFYRGEATQKKSEVLGLSALVFLNDGFLPDTIKLPAGEVYLNLCLPIDEEELKEYAFAIKQDSEQHVALLDKLFHRYPTGYRQ